MRLFRKTVALALSFLMAVVFPIPHSALAINYDSAREESEPKQPEKDWTTEPAGENLQQLLIEQKTKDVDLSAFFNDTAITTADDNEKIVKQHEVLGREARAQARYDYSEYTAEGRASLQYAMALASDGQAVLEVVDVSSITAEDLQEFRNASVEHALFFFEINKRIEAIYVSSGSRDHVRVDPAVLQAFDFYQDPLFVMHNHTGETEFPPALSDYDLSQAVNSSLWEVAGNGHSWLAYNQGGVLSTQVTDEMVLGRIQVFAALYQQEMDPESEAETRAHLNELMTELEKLKEAQRALAFNEGLILRADVTELLGTDIGTGDVPSSLPNYTTTTVAGKFVTALPNPNGIAYRYDVRSGVGPNYYARMIIKNDTGPMDLGSSLTLFMEASRAATDPSDLTFPVIVRIKITDTNGNFIEVDARVMDDKKAFTIALNDPTKAYYNSLFDSSQVQSVEFIQHQSIVGAVGNQRAEIIVDVKGILGNENDAPPKEDPAIRPASQLTGFPTITTAGNFVTYVQSEGGFSYRFDDRSSALAEPRVIVENAGSTMGLPSPALTMHLQAEGTGEALTQPLKLIVKLTDATGKMILAPLEIRPDSEGVWDLQAYTINLDVNGFDYTKIKKIELIHNPQIDSLNRHAKINVKLGGFAMGQSPISGASITDETPTPSVITNIYNIAYMGGNIVSSPLAGANELVYQYDIQKNSGEASVGITNLNGAMTVPETLIFRMKAGPTDSNPKAVSSPVPVLLRITDASGETVTAVLNVSTTELQSFQVNLHAINSQIHLDQIKKVEFVHSKTISDNDLRARIQIQFSGLQPTDSIDGVDPVTEPSQLLGATPELAPITIVPTNSRYVKELTPDGFDGLSYTYDVTRSVMHQAVMKIQTPEGTFALDDPAGVLVLHMKASQSRTTLLPPVKVKIRLTDANNNVIETFLKVETTLKEFRLNLPSFSSQFDYGHIKSIEFISTQAITGPLTRVNGNVISNQTAQMDIHINGLGSKESVPDLIKSGNQTILVYKDRVTNRVVREEYYEGLHERADLPPNTTLQPVLVKHYLDNDNNGTNDAVLMNDYGKNQTTHILLEADGKIREQRLYGGGMVATLADLNAKITDGTMKLLQKIVYLTDNAQLIVKYNALGAPIRYSLQQDLGNKRTLIASPVTSTGLVRDDTVFTLQEELADGSILVAVPVNSDGSAKADTRYSKQTVLPDGGTLIASPVSSDGSATADTQYAKQKDIADDFVLISSPVDASGAANADTRYSKQKELEGGSLLTASPVNADGSDIAGDTKYTKQKELADGYILISSPVNGDGTVNENTRYLKQKEFADGNTVIASPVNEDGSDIAGETKYTKQKALANGYTLIATPVGQDGNATADTQYSKQKELADGSVIIASPVNADGSDIAGETKYTKQKTLASGYTLISTPVDQDGNATADTQHMKQKELADGSVIIASPVNADGSDIAGETKYTKQ
ncbi:MAG: hypothetical protein PHN49_02770, partial [Candidatus Omnitrophica bacterium]|nr:hypothetical protein [Candidatus Omnitrophota bacterium]MDD5670542.1 hypothetical protein [Candidatus Omnitrophota bacterium]